MKQKLILVVLFFLFFGCKKTENPLENKKKIEGSVQKGPFAIGTNITINELNQDLSQTGRTFTTQISDKSGHFSINNINLSSDYISLRADGFYFNEVLGLPSKAQITLNAISDISDKNIINVNILSHLEKPRVEYLIEHGISFSDAKVQAQAEVLNVFNLESPNFEPSEDLNIVEEGESNAILLAISVILQGFRKEGELSEILSIISNDLKEDGVFENNALGSKLINHAVYLNTASIRTNLENRYLGQNINATIPNFEKYITHFIDSSDFEVTETLIGYPPTGIFGDNILDLDKTNYEGQTFSLRATLVDGASLKIKITSLSQNPWLYTLGSNINWSITLYDYINHSQYFTIIEPDQNSDLQMLFDAGSYLVEYYEMGSILPTRSKIITK
jgi:hypothetical protein